jgi:hypothetical protein
VAATVIAGMTASLSIAVNYSWVFFSTCRKALPNMGRAFQFVDYRDGVILN